MSKLRKNATYMITGQLATVFFQGVQFFLVARALGPEEFGRVAGMLAITAALLPFSGVGAGNVMVMRLARRDGEPQVYFGNALVVVLVSGILLTLLALLINATLLRGVASWENMLLFALSEIMMTKLIDIAVHVFYGLDRHEFSGFFYALQSAFRMLLSASLFLFPHPTAWHWGCLHLAAGAAAMLVVVIMTIRQVGLPKPNIHLALKELKVGVFFSIGLSSKSLYTDIDKAVLARFASPEICGAYTAAFRLIFIAYTPIRAILQASMARFFRAGTNGVTGPVQFANKIVFWAALYAITFAICVYVAAPMVRLLLGDAYTMSVSILQSLALVPLVLVLQDVYSDALTGAGRQGLRSIFQVIVAILCFCSNMVLVPMYSWAGSVTSTYLSQALLAVLIIGCIVVLSRRSSPASDATSLSPERGS